MKTNNQFMEKTETTSKSNCYNKKLADSYGHMAHVISGEAPSILSSNTKVKLE